MVASPLSSSAAEHLPSAMSWAALLPLPLVSCTRRRLPTSGLST
ncbi:GlyGly-CTERM sorting domain-containing protein, partial [Pseudomonas frederiksbergensis]|nr:GlyGly-CTERM sorting domain-containing protein [Pseudomonas frederiksbergensis]